MKTIVRIILSAFLILSVHSVTGQELPNPFRFPILLSGSFGELRSNHFHSGIDFKTQGAEGKPIYAVMDGFVSRISVSPGGYGNALYIDHPNGTTTVYGHLLRFTPEVAAYIKEEQYKQEKFNVNLYPSAEQFSFKTGDLIAYSGNTGSSGGPHLHFEVRDTKTEEALDPIVYFKGQITDKRPPRIQGLMFYPAEGEGIVAKSNKKQEFKQFQIQGDKYTLSEKIEAWGKFGVGIKAYDFMDNTQNIYGVKEIILKVDDEVIFHSDITRFAFDETRFLNSFTDYADWIENRSFYMKSFVEPGNKLRFIETKNRGYIWIDQERPYHLTYILRDAFGNTSQLSMTIIGKEQDIPAPDTTNRELFFWGSENKFGAKGIRLTIPKGNLYDTFYFSYQIKHDSSRLAPVHILHDRPTPLHRNAQLSLRLFTDTLPNKRQYGIVRIHKGRRSWIGGNYQNGWIEGQIRELGQYTLEQDTTPPKIIPVEQGNWISKQKFVFRLTDNLSGVKEYKGLINGQFALFEMNNKSVITYSFDKERLSPGQHMLELTVTDACGNESVYTHSFSI